MTKTIAFAVACAVALATTPAHARSHHHHRHVRQTYTFRGHGDPRPGNWCAWFLRRALGIPKTAFRPGDYNLAAGFAHVGVPAGGPGDGVIVVWRHHVGIITGRAAGQWVVRSGNDGHAVRERPRSLRGVIAYRRWMPGRRAFAQTFGG